MAGITPPEEIFLERLTRAIQEKSQTEEHLAAARRLALLEEISHDLREVKEDVKTLLIWRAGVDEKIRQLEKDSRRGDLYATLTGLVAAVSAAVLGEFRR